jgi:hypothetical protein
MDPVATYDLPRAQLHSDGDDSVRWQGAFISYGGHGAAASTIDFEIEPVPALAGVPIRSQSVSSPPRCSPRTSTT